MASRISPGGKKRGIRLSHNSAFDIRRSEQTIRQKLIEAKAVDVMVAKGQLRWSLNPSRYVGVAAGEDLSDEDFKEQLETLQEELEGLNAHVRELEATIALNVAGILEA
jgi:type I restriction-modification system DNA methylase subunit